MFDGSRTAKLHAYDRPEQAAFGFSHEIARTLRAMRQDAALRWSATLENAAEITRAFDTVSAGAERRERTRARTRRESLAARSETLVLAVDAFLESIDHPVRDLRKGPLRSFAHSFGADAVLPFLREEERQERAARRALSMPMHTSRKHADALRDDIAADTGARAAPEIEAYRARLFAFETNRAALAEKLSLIPAPNGAIAESVSACIALLKRVDTALALKSSQAFLKVETPSEASVAFKNLRRARRQMKREGDAFAQAYEKLTLRSARLPAGERKMMQSALSDLDQYARFSNDGPSHRLPGYVRDTGRLTQALLTAGKRVKALSLFDHRSDEARRVRESRETVGQALHAAQRAASRITGALDSEERRVRGTRNGGKHLGQRKDSKAVRLLYELKCGTSFVFPDRLRAYLRDAIEKETRYRGTINKTDSFGDAARERLQAAYRKMSEQYSLAYWALGGARLIGWGEKARQLPPLIDPAVSYRFIRSVHLGAWRMQDAGRRSLSGLKRAAIFGVVRMLAPKLAPVKAQ